MRTQKLLTLPNPETIKSLEDAKEVLRQLVRVIEDNNRDIHDDIKELQP